MGLKKVMTIRHALQHVANNPYPTTEVMLDIPAYELVSRTLFEIANGATMGDSRSQSRANVARKLIFDRLVGKRRSGSHPATRQAAALEFKDLTGGMADEQ